MYLLGDSFVNFGLNRSIAEGQAKTYPRKSFLVGAQILSYRRSQVPLCLSLPKDLFDNASRTIRVFTSPISGADEEKSHPSFCCSLLFSLAVARRR